MLDVVPVTLDVTPRDRSQLTLEGEQYATAREILRPLHARADEIGAGMAHHLHASIPELHHPDERAIFSETEASCASNMDQLLGLLSRGEPASALIVPEPAIRYAQGLVRRRIPLDVLLRAYRLGHAYVWDLIVAALRREIDRDNDLMPALQTSAAFLFEYVDLVSAEIVPAYHVERDRWVRSAAAVRAETAREIIDGHSLTEATASARLGYALRRHHIAAVLAVDEAVSVAVAELSLEREAHAARSALGAGEILVIPAGASVLWAWFGMAAAPSRAMVSQLDAYATSVGVRMAIGQPAFGLDGFRVSHIEAQHAARFLSSPPNPQASVSYRDIELVSLLAADLPRARRFVAGELGPLARDTETAEEQRRTLMAFLGCGASHVHAAEVLHVHANTVYKKVRRIEQLLEVPVAERRVQLTNALMLAQTLGDQVLRSD